MQIKREKFEDEEKIMDVMAESRETEMQRLLNAKKDRLNTILLQKNDM